ncbi:MAG: response regulator [Bryobacteraceae bacterium]|nr:response regulator [Bryobacteraceae bacterium]
MKARILIVEDESIVQLDLQNRLERLGYSVVGTASRGEEAIAKAVELTPDLVLMDVRLEGAMDGVEAARQIREVQGTPVIYLTAYEAMFPDAVRREVLRPCLSKPFRTAELQSAIDRTLADLNGPQGSQ